MKIRTQMIVVFAAVALLPMAIAAVFAYRLGRERLDRQTDQTLLMLDRRVAAEVDEFAFRSSESLRSASLIPTLVNFVASPPVNPRDPLRASVTELLLAAAVPDPVNVTSCALFDASGRKLVDTAPRLDGFDESEQPWVRGPLASGLTAIVPTPDGPDGSALWIGRPVRDARGHIIGAMRLRYELSVLQQIISGLGGEAAVGVLGAVFDERGRVLARSGSARAWGASRLTVPEVSGQEPVLASLRWSRDAQDDDPPDRIAVQALRQVPWRVAVAETDDVFHQAATDLYRTMIWMGALIVVLCAVTAFLLSALFSGPITGLANAAAKIGRGELAVTVPEAGAGEIAVLGRTFNEMSRRLSGTLGELEDKISALRTSEERLREVIDSIPIGLLVRDDQEGMLIANRKFHEMFGYTAEDIPHLEDWWPLAYPDPAYRAEIELEWHARVAEARRTGQEMRPMLAFVRCKDGTRKEIEFRYRQLGPRGITLLADVTERRRTEQALEASEQQNRILLEHALEATLVLDYDTGRFVDCNPSLERMFKLTRAEVLQRGPVDLSPPVQPDGRDSGEAGQRRTREALDGTTPMFEWTHRDSTGRDFRCEVRLVRLPDPTRHLVRAVIVDIEERGRALQQLRRSEQRFATVFNASPIGLAITSIESGVVLDANPAVCRIVGFPRERVLGMKTTDFTQWAFGERELIVSEVLRKGRSVPFEKQLRTSGESVTALIHFEAIEIDGQKRLLVALNDITERKRTEQILRDSEERFRLLVENSNELVVQVTLEGIILYASPNHAAITGRGPEELVGTSVFTRVHPDDQAAIVAKFRGSEGHGLFRYQYRDGTWHWLEASGRRYRLRSGEERGVIVSRDVSDRVIGDETRKRLEAQLRQSQKMEAIGTLAGGIAHDFNNILTGLLGHLQLIEMDVPADAVEIRHSLAEAAAAGGRAKDLVAQILAFSRQREQKRTVISLGSHVREALRFLRASLPTTITIQSDITTSDTSVLADPTQMHQVVMNLGVNAGHAMRDHGGELTVAVQRVDPEPALAAAHPNLQPGRTLRLTVRDTGTGMDPAIVERIFDPFFTTKPVGEGTGLGLAIVHGIAQDHGAAIVVESRPGEGTTFHLYFPLADSAPTKAAAPVAEVPQGHSEHVLLVDDELLVLSVAKPMLRRLGYRTTVFDKSRAALEAYERAPNDFDLVVTDLTMPEVTGVELATRIRALRPDQPVLITTGYMRSADLATARASGLTHFLSKPFTLSSLAEGVQQAIARPRRAI